MISTLVTLTVGVYAGLYLSKSGLTFEKASSPIRSLFRVASERFSTQEPKEKKKAKK